MFFLNPILSICIIIFLSILSVIFGRILYERIFLRHSENLISLDLGISFFMGLSAITVFWKFADFITRHAVGSLFAVIISAFIICIIHKNESKKNLLQILDILKNKFVWAFVFLITILTLAIEIDPQYPQFFSSLQLQEASDVHLPLNQGAALANIGTAHSGFHSEVASFIYRNNYIPVSALDIGRSLLDAMPMLVGIKLPVWNAFVWLVITKIFFLIFLLGFFQKLGLSLRHSIYGILVVYLGNTALSFLHIIPFAMMSPVFFINYDSPFFVLELLLVAILWMIQLPYKKHSTSSLCYDLLWIFILAASCIFGIHLLILILPAMVVFLGYLILSKKYFLNHAVAVFLMMGVTSIYCIFSGCGLTPLKLRENKLSISNLVNRINHPSTITINPYVWYSTYIGGNNFRGHVYDRGGYGYSASHTQTLQSARQLIKGNWIQKFYGAFDFLVILEQELWFALRIFFFSVLGFILGYFTLKKFHASKELKNIFCISLFIFLTGFSLSFFFDFEGVDGIRNTLSRFAQPGAILGLILLAYSLSRWIPHLFAASQKQAIAWCGSLLIICFGPMLSLTTEVVSNVSSDQFGLLVKFLVTH